MGAGRLTSLALLIAGFGLGPAGVGAQDAPETTKLSRQADSQTVITITRPGDPPTEVTVTDDELRALAQKLDDFGGSLSPTERLMMDWLLQRAAGAPPDDPAGTVVHGYLFTPPLVVTGGGEGEEAETSDAPTPDAAAPGAGERTSEISPSPMAALARALGIRLIGAAPPARASDAPEEP